MNKSKRFDLMLDEECLNIINKIPIQLKSYYVRKAIIEFNKNHTDYFKE